MKAFINFALDYIVSRVQPVPFAAFIRIRSKQPSRGRQVVETCEKWREQGHCDVYV